MPAVFRKLRYLNSLPQTANAQLIRSKCTVKYENIHETVDVSLIFICKSNYYTTGELG